MLRRQKIECDALVVGGGMSGICAAIAAARSGIKVVLMQERSVLGGNASLEIRMWICSANGKNNRETGILEEILLENLHKNPTKNYYVWNALLYEFVMREKNITLLLNCTCMDATIEKGEFKYGRNTRIKTVTGYQMTTQTFFDVDAKIVSDCSGDSILQALTGAEYRYGREAKSEFNEDTKVETNDSMTMGMSILLEGRETTKEVEFITPNIATKLSKENFENRNLDISKSNENYWYLELGGDKDSIYDTENVSKELLPLALGTWDYIKNSGEFDSKNWELEFLGFIPGKRESKRLVGEYIITERDIILGKVFDDEVAFGGWTLDDHYPAGFYHKGEPNTNVETPSPYSIPYRALYSKNVENLMFAGRNISMTHMAMSSIRIMATCALMGQAVGTAMAIAIKNKYTPHEVYLNSIKELQKILMDNDCFLPHFKRTVSKLCPVSELSNGEDRPHAIYNSEECGKEILNSEKVEYSFKESIYINSIHITFDGDLNRHTTPGDWSERHHPMRANIRLNSPIMKMPTTLCRDFILEIEDENKEEKIEIKDNLKRSYHFDINKKIKRISIKPISNWGDTDKTRIFSFDFN